MISIGYVGAEAFDIILYTGKILTRLNIPVLIIDLSDTGALSKSIYHGMELDSSEDIIHYRMLNYTRRIAQESDLEDYHNGVVLVSYGFNYVDQSIPLDVLHIIADPFPHTTDRINRLTCKLASDNMKIRVLVRDILTFDDFERVKNEIIRTKKSINMRHLYYDLHDHENAIRCQISQVIHLRKTSSGMKKILMDKISDILPDIKASRIRKAVFWQGKG